MNEQVFVESLATELRLKRVGAVYLAGPCPLCGGRDRFTVKLNSQNRWVWHCRKCSNEGWQSLQYLNHKLTGNWGYDRANVVGNVVERLNDNNNLGYSEANVVKPSNDNKRRKPASFSLDAKRAPVRLPDKQYRDRLLDVVYDAVTLLYKGKGKPVKEYLRARCISEGSMYRHLLGAREVNGRLAVSIPIFEEGGEIYAIKYRFIWGEPRYSFEKLDGYTALTWGLHTLNWGKTLFVVEGELNAISLAQVAAELGVGLAVLSTGSQNWRQHLEFLRNIRRNYRRVLVWYDEQEVANEVGHAIVANKIIWSPIVNGDKLDANAMLQKGLLTPLLKDLL